MYDAAGVGPSLQDEKAFGVVDAHTHVFSPEVIESRSAFVGRDLCFEYL